VRRLPPAAQLISSFLPVGALAMSAFGALGLGGAALGVLPGINPALLKLQPYLPATGLAVALLLYS
jgi:hypothetical protein